MKRVLNYLIITLAIAVMGISFTGCSKENGGKGLKGLYLTPAWDWDGTHKWRKGIDFINGNTVKMYDYIMNYKHWYNDIIGDFSEPLGYENWYFQEGCDRRATYYLEGNKVYIPMEGMILTIEGNTLYPDGSGTSYTKCK